MVSTLTFSRSLYEPEAVDAAAQAFREFGRITVLAEAASIRVTLEDMDSRIADLPEHFANRVLNETIERQRAGQAV